MSAETVASLPTIDHKQHSAFFRQSGWLMIANIGAGFMTLGVHFLSKKIPEAEYAAFGMLLMVVACVPTLPLQMVFAQQTAQALATGRPGQLASMIRLAWLWTFLLWALVAAAVFLFQKQIVTGWQLPSAAGLLIMLPLFLFSLWVPMFSGVLLGRQDFFWLGWSVIYGGVARFALGVFLVLALALGAAGMIAGAMIGVGLAAGICIWRTRDLWTARAEAFAVGKLLRQIVPLTLGFGACQFMFTSDTIFAKAYFNDDQMAPYVAAGTLSRALLWLVLPLASVMFPKIVHASARAEKSNLFGIVVLGTAVLAFCGGLGLWLLGPWVVKLVFTKDYILATTRLIPWYAAAMVPLAMANVLVNDLLARSRFGVVPFMVALAVAYGFALPAFLNHFPGRLEIPLQILGAFNLLLFVICAVFTWVVKPRPPQPQSVSPAGSP
jgi:O-antigen/teichoic acid export membrane protein